MAHFILKTEIRAPAERCFDLSRDIDLHSASMSASGERAVAGVCHGLIGLDEEVTWEARHFGIRWRMTSRIVEFEFPNRFVDQMQKGPFASWHHEHRFERSSDGMTTMIDVVDYRPPLRFVGLLVDTLALGRYMRELLKIRNLFIKSEAESH